MNIPGKGLFNKAKALLRRVFTSDSIGDFQPERLSHKTYPADDRERDIRTSISRREMNLDAEEFRVKRKLGRAWFTRRLSPGMRHKRLHSLKKHEREIARAFGWIA